jgi:hypothetical protein
LARNWKHDELVQFSRKSISDKVQPVFENDQYYKNLGYDPDLNGGFSDELFRRNFMVFQGGKEDFGRWVEKSCAFSKIAEFAESIVFAGKFVPLEEFCATSFNQDFCSRFTKLNSLFVKLSDCSEHRLSQIQAIDMFCKIFPIQCLHLALEYNNVASDRSLEILAGAISSCTNLSCFQFDISWNHSFDSRPIYVDQRIVYSVESALKSIPSSASLQYFTVNDMSLTIPICKGFLNHFIAFSKTLRSVALIGLTIDIEEFERFCSVMDLKELKLINCSLKNASEKGVTNQLCDAFRSVSGTIERLKINLDYDISPSNESYLSLPNSFKRIEEFDITCKFQNIERVLSMIFSCSSMFPTLSCLVIRIIHEYPIPPYQICELLPRYVKKSMPNLVEFFIFFDLGLDYIDLSDFIDTDYESFFHFIRESFPSLQFFSIPDPYFSDADKFSTLLETYMCLFCEEE